MTKRNFVIEAEGYPAFTPVMWSTVCVLKELGGMATVRKIAECIIEQEQISEEAQSYLMPNGADNKLEDSLGWSRTYLRYGEALENPKHGVWKLTELGFEIGSLADTEEVFKRAHEKIVQQTKDRKNQKNKTKQQLNQNKETQK